LFNFLGVRRSGAVRLRGGLFNLSFLFLVKLFIEKRL
jgi:hypothetical protein